MNLIRLRKVELGGEVATGWHIAVLAAAVARGYFPKIHAPYWQTESPMTQDINDAILYLVTNYPMEFILSDSA